MVKNAVSQYLKVQNRPYSLNDIFMNLHKEFGKTAVQKALDQLVSDGKIYEKAYGKQKVYCVVQDSSQSAEELIRIQKESESHANEIDAKLQEVEKELRIKEHALSATKSTLSIEEAQEEIKKLEASVQKLKQKLNKLTEDHGSDDLSAAKKLAQEEFDKYSREYLKRKRMCLEIVDCILEGYPGNKSALYEDIGIEVKIVE